MDAPCVTESRMREAVCLPEDAQANATKDARRQSAWAEDIWFRALALQKSNWPQVAAQWQTTLASGPPTGMAPGSSFLDNA